ncbi:uncharacterized protein [Bemisia tabaci]|uniref:uncharacterized protein isoform X1 n=2 Tax=Bemisia tabaci TaxID=7038 RepID=UPI003B289BC8
MNVPSVKCFISCIIICLAHLSRAVINNLETKMNSFFTDIMTDSKYNLSGLKPQLDKLFLDFQAYGSENFVNDQKSDSEMAESFIESIQDIMTIPAAFPTVMYLFTLPHSPTTWSICLQANDDPQNTDLLLMVLREYDETSESWITGDSVPVKTCTQLEIKDIDGAVFIFLLTKDFNEEPQMNMYSIIDSRFFLSQTSSVGKIHFLTVWDEPNGNNIFLGILSGDNHDRSFCSLHIYQWDYSSFALFDLIPMHCATTIKSFLLNSSVFLAVCHRWNESDKLGAGNHTTLFKFNEELQSFEVHQLLSMSNCSNIEYFEYASSDFSKPEQFLVITGLHGDQENSPISRIYKLHDEYFYPFQTISLDYVQQWMMYGSAGESILLAATRYSGIHLFEYDGRKFSKTDCFLETAVIIISLNVR